jgi:hypothetical protein
VNLLTSLRSIVKEYSVPSSGGGGGGGGGGGSNFFIFFERVG